MSENKEVMSWQDAMKARAAEQARKKAALQQGNKFITFRNGMLQIDGTPIPGNRLSVVVLAFTAENAFYPGKFDPTNSKPPVCFSVYNDTANMVPNNASTDMQHENCVECPNFQWHSDPNGGRGKACKSRYRIAVIPAGFTTVEEVQSAEMRLGVLPVTSGKDFELFMTKCDLSFQRPTFGVIAELSVAPDAKTQFKVSLNPQAAIPGELMLAIMDRVDKAEKDIAYIYEAQPEAEPEAPAKKLK